MISLNISAMKVFFFRSPFFTKLYHYLSLIIPRPLAFFDPQDAIKRY